jgi:hypothetical protein
MTPFLITSLALVAIAFSSCPAMSEAPSLINYQGIITDADGMPLDGSYTLTFKIYSDSASGVQYWFEQHPNTDISDGLFNVILGEDSPLPDELFDNTELWMGVSVDADPEVAPRTRLTAVPWAVKAAEADSADGVRWMNIVGVPAGFADGVDDVGGAGDGHSLDAADGSPVDAVYVNNDGDVGIGTTSPAAKLQLDGTLVVGTPASGHDITCNGDTTGARLFWDASKSALRAGVTTGTEWDDANTGYYSLASGWDTRASGGQSTALGRFSVADGVASFAAGNAAIAQGHYSTALGTHARANGLFSTAIGWGATAGGDISMAMGRHVRAGPADYSMVIGRGMSTADSLVNDIENSLAIGFNTNYPTLFVGGPYRRVGINTSYPAEDFHVNGTCRFDDQVTAEAIDVEYYLTTFHLTTEDFEMSTGASSGFVLTSDATGYGTWEPPASVPDADWMIADSNMYSNVSGNVGIGDSNPTHKLDIHSDAGSAYLNITDGSTGNGSTDGLNVGLNGSGHAFIYNHELARNLYIGTSSSIGVTLDSSGELGIGTPSPAAKLDVIGTVKVGEDASGYDVNFYGDDTGGRFFWDASKMALRAGRTSGSEWDDANVGLYSLAHGYGAKATHAHSIALGQSSLSSNLYATSIGGFTDATGYGSTSIGWGTLASTNYSTAVGYYATASGLYSAAHGRYVTASGDTSVVIGSGVGSSNRLENSTGNSLAIGFNSDTPTLFVGPSSGIGTTGNVGVGTSGPNGPLHIESSININSGSNFASRRAPLVVGNGDGSTECILVDGNQIDQAASYQHLNLNFNSDSDITMVMGGGNVGIGTTSPGYKLQVGELGDGTEARANDWNTFSSREYKKDITTLSDAEYREVLSALEELEVVRYRYNGDSNDRELRMGVIAEDAPSQLVTEDRKALSHADAIGFLLAAIKAQQEEIGLLKKEVRDLRTD